jgi:hypothetical protein
MDMPMPVNWAPSDGRPTKPAALAAVVSTLVLAYAVWTWPGGPFRAAGPGGPVATSPARSASFGYPCAAVFAGDDSPPAGPAGTGSACAVAADRNGDLAVGDAGRISLIPITSGLKFGQVMQADDVYLLAGAGQCCHSPADGGRTANFDSASLTFDRFGNLLVADAEQSVVRVIAARNGDFYGRHMTAGHIYLVVNNGRAYSPANPLHPENNPGHLNQPGPPATRR